MIWIKIIKCWKKLLSHSDLIGELFFFSAIISLVSQLIYYLVTRNSFSSNWLGISLGFLSVGLGFIAIGMSLSSDIEHREQFQSINETMKTLKYSNREFINPPWAQTITREAENHTEPEKKPEWGKWEGQTTAYMVYC
jgi:hypothetical protein